ncbi:dihydroorotase [Methanobrevibacter curvatus]|uniref:Dihydroorotase n=1 Tax=Methanobrevibacter curvatus TaxID=49547 RepID=A0A165ZQI4_9EURY|nr:dihydroorotase family protein [Methanobrevibacter curvatus]KZX11032.1 dihydroorotase [Methanobrevibacter curvatus]
MSEIILKNSKIVNKKGEYNIKLLDGKIAEISKEKLYGDEEIDIDGNIVLPGLIDPHVHFRDPGLTYKESFKTGSMAAANGGFTTVIDMPNTLPPTNTAKDFKEKEKIAKNKSVVNFKLHAGVNKKSTVKEIEKIAKLNPASFKIFMDLEKDEILDKIFNNISIVKNNLLTSPELNKESNKELNKGLNKKIIITSHCENKSIIEESTKKQKQVFCIRGNTALDYSYARPSSSEIASVRYAIELAKKYSIDLHICHISVLNALKIVKEENNLINKKIKKNNINNINNKTNKDNKDKNNKNNCNCGEILISTEVTPHHLFLDNFTFKKYETVAKTNPPLRPLGENLTVDNLKEINMIGTDHAPHTLEEKKKGVWNSAPGIPNLETCLSLLLTEVNKGKIDLNLIQKVMCENSAKRFGLDKKGEIRVGKDADIVVIDLKKEGKFNLDEFYTKAHYSPFENQKYVGKAIKTFVNGKLIMENGEIYN